MQVTQSLGQVRGDELAQKVLRVRVHVWRVLDPGLEDVLVYLHGRTAVPEGRESAEHFVDEDTQRPPIAGK